MNPKHLTDYDCMLLGISRPSVRREEEKESPAEESQPSPPSPTTSDGKPSESQAPGESIDEDDISEYLSYLNSLAKLGVVF